MTPDFCNRVIANTTSNQSAADFFGEYMYITAVHNANTSEATLEFGVHSSDSKDTGGNTVGSMMDFQMAPRTSISFPIPLRCTEFKPTNANLTVFFYVEQTLNTTY